MANLNLRVNVDVQGADKLSGLGNSMQRTGFGLTKFVTLPVLGAAAGMLKLAADAEKSGAKLESTFKSMGASAWTSVEALDAQAEALGKLSSFDDDEITEAQAVMLTFGNVTEEAFDKGIQAAVDMSEALGTDLQSSTIQLGKALNDPIKGITALQRVGVSFTEDQREMIASLVESGDVLGAQNVILEEMQRQFGGTAEALANTNAGQAAQAFEDLANAGESIGTLLLPVLGTLASWLSTLVGWFTGLPEPMRNTIVTIGALVAAIGPALLIGGKLISAFGAVGGAFKALSLILLANPFVALAAAIAAIVILIITNWDAIVAFLKGVWDKIAGGFKTLANILEGVWNGIKMVVTSIWDAIVGAIRGAINGVIGVINAFIRFINGIQIHIPAVGVGPFQTPAFDWWGLGIREIPFLAEGGIVNRATLAVLGERGPEAVVPLDRSASGIMGETHFHVHLTVEGNLVAETPEEVVEVLRRATPFLDGWAENGLALSNG